MLIYLSLSTLTVLTVALFFLKLDALPLPAAVHAVFAVGVLPLIVGVICHFLPVLTRSAQAPRAILLAPLLLQVCGVLAVLHFLGQIDLHQLGMTAVVALIVAGVFAGWMIQRARDTLGRPHPCWRWYLAAIIFLIVATMLVPAMDTWPAMRPTLRLLHIHFNTLGFIGLTALGTVQVLLPTVVGQPDPGAAARLRNDLPLVVAGVLAVAIGAAFWLPLALAGVLLLGFPVLKAGAAWLLRYGPTTIEAPAAALLTALSGFLLLVVGGIAHALHWLEGRDALLAFIVAFLLPLLSGALSQLLPVWWHPGKHSPARQRMHDALRQGGVGRPLFFLAGGILLGMGLDAGVWLTLIGLVSLAITLWKAVLDPHPPDGSHDHGAG
ncbi:MAG: hypothetical protein JNL84_02535 [Candidatus Accumulibacter sp.]|nr:hypothetical protein [Accumulibacter sp.]